MFSIANGASSISDELISLANAFSRVGQEGIAKELFDLSNRAHSLNCRVREAVAEKTTFDLQESQKMTATILKGFIPHAGE